MVRQGGSDDELPFQVLSGRCPFLSPSQMMMQAYPSG